MTKLVNTDQPSLSDSPAAAQPAQGPCLGQIYLSDRQGIFSTNVWVLIAMHPEQKDVFLAVSADNIQLWAGDEVSVPQSQSTAAWTMRCHFCEWLPASRLRPESLKGSIEESQIREAHEVIHAVASGRGRTPATWSIAEHPEWIRAIENARKERSTNGSHDQDP